MITFLTICFIFGIFAGACLILGAIYAILKQLFLGIFNIYLKRNN